MGQLYDVAITGDIARVTCTLTSHGWPREAVITQSIRDAVGCVDGITGVETNLVWEPAWHPGMISKEAWPV